MAKQFMQLRYDGADDGLNFQDANGRDIEWSNNIIDQKYVTQLGIYAVPGTTFLLNQDNQIRGEQLIINSTGIFQIDVEERPITSLRIGKDSYEKLKSGQGHYIIVDIVHEGGIQNG